MLTFNTPELDPDTIRARACADIYPFARAQALADPDPTAALICDAAAALAARHGADLPHPPPEEAETVTLTRALRRGTETIGAPYTLPADLSAATDALLDLARRYASARPGFVTGAVATVEEHLTRARLGHTAGIPDRRTGD